MADELNPYAAPRVTDLEAARPARWMGASILPPEAAREITGSARWARWTARLAAAALVVAPILDVLSLGPGSGPREIGQVVGQRFVPTLFGVILVLAFRRYAASAERFAGASAEEQAADEVLEAQRRCLRSVGVLLSIVLGLFLLGLVVGFIMGRHSRG
jgi:hypothetical protein